MHNASTTLAASGGSFVLRGTSMLDHFIGG